MTAKITAALEQPQDHFPNAGNRVPTEWKLVPVEPTSEMIAAGKESMQYSIAELPAFTCYNAMLAAAPQPPTVKDSLTTRPQVEQEPVSKSHNYLNGYCAGRTDLLKELQDTDEPVAWRCFDGEGDFEYQSEEPSEETRAWSSRYNREWEPLYRHRQPQVEQEPVAWQRRMRTKWMRDGEWWPWQECSKEVADDYKRAPIVNDWEYESRALYTHPQPPRQPLTDDEIEKLFPYTHEWLYEIGLEEATKFARSIEAAHGIGGEA